MAIIGGRIQIQISLLFDWNLLFSQYNLNQADFNREIKLRQITKLAKSYNYET